MGGFEAISGPGGAIVQDSEPVVEAGRVWFDTSPSGAVDMKLADDTGWTLIMKIPDDQVTSFDYSEAGFGQLDNFDPLGELSQKAFVQSSSPEHEPGRIWFDPSPSNGIDVHVANDTDWTLVGQIPYLSEIAPSADFSSSPIEPTTDDTVSFSAGNYANVSSYTIDYDDDRRLAERTDLSSIPNHNYASTGDYEPVLSVENKHGMTVSYTTSIGVLEPANFDVSIDSVTDSPVAGDTLSVDVTVNNTGEVSDSQTIRLDADGSQRDSTSVSLDGGNSTTKTLEWDTSTDDSGTYDLTVSSDDDSATQKSVDILEPAYFTVDSITDPGDTEVGNTASIETTIKNTGGAQGTKDVSLKLDGSNVDTKSLTIDGGNTKTTTLEWNPSDSDTGENTLTVETDDGNSDTVKINVTDPDPATFEVVFGEHDFSEDIYAAYATSMFTGGTAYIHFTVKNTGDEEGTVTVTSSNEYEYRGVWRTPRDIETSTHTLSGGGSTNVTHFWSIESGRSEPGDRKVTVEVTSGNTDGGSEISQVVYIYEGD